VKFLLARPGPHGRMSFDFDEEAFLAVFDENEPVGAPVKWSRRCDSPSRRWVYVDIGGKAPVHAGRSECGPWGDASIVKEKRFPKGLAGSKARHRGKERHGMVTVGASAAPSPLAQSWEHVNR